MKNRARNLNVTHILRGKKIQCVRGYHNDSLYPLLICFILIKVNETFFYHSHMERREWKFDFTANKFTSYCQWPTDVKFHFYSRQFTFSYHKKISFRCFFVVYSLLYSIFNALNRWSSNRNVFICFALKHVQNKIEHDYLLNKVHLVCKELCGNMHRNQ